MSDFSVHDYQGEKNFCSKADCNHLWNEKKPLKKAEPDICRAQFIFCDFSYGKIKASGNH